MDKRRTIIFSIILFLFLVLIGVIFVTSMFSGYHHEPYSPTLNANAKQIYFIASAWLKDCEEVGYDTNFTLLSEPIEREKMLSADPFNTGLILPDFTFKDYLGENFSGNVMVYIKNGEVVQAWWWADKKYTEKKWFKTEKFWLIGGYPYYRLESAKPNEQVYKSLDDITIESLKPFIFEREKKKNKFTLMNDEFEMSNNIFKHKKNITEPVIEETLDEVLLNLKEAIYQLPIKQQHLLTDWISIWTKYLIREKTFEPERLGYYKRGEILHVNFGYNAGREYGGAHYAVVIDISNKSKNDCIVVIPTSSLEYGKTKEQLYPTEIYLGKIIPNSEIESFALPMQIRTISKLRIIKPKGNDKRIRLSSEKMNLIDDKIRNLFTRELDK